MKFKIFANTTAGLYAINTRHHDVENDGIERILSGEVECGKTVQGKTDRIIPALENALQQIKIVLHIIDNQYMVLLIVHGGVLTKSV